MTNDQEQKVQKEFDILKLEVSKLERQNNIKPFTDRQRFRAETIRLFVIAAVTGLVTYFVNQKTEDVKLDNSFDLEEYKGFIAHKSSFYIGNHSLQERQKLACQINDRYKSTDNADILLDLKDIASLCKKDSVLQIAENLIEEKAPVVEEKVSKSYVASIEKTEKESRAVEQLLRVKTNDESLKARQEVLNHEMDRLLTQNIDVNNLSKKSEGITENVNEQASIINRAKQQEAVLSERKPAPGYPFTSWFKEGYFLVFDDMKIVLENINMNNNSITVSVCYSVSSAPCSPNERIALPSNELSTNSPITLKRNGFSYVIRLERIGNAGRNPFTKAAYVTFEKYGM